MSDFKAIYGNEAIISHLQNAISMKKVSHAYILVGEEGMGKKLISRVFAKTLQCEEGGITPCNTCSSCRLLDAGNHPDIKEIITDKKTGLGVEEVREQINMDIMVKPYRYPYKIYIVHGADMMTIAAQNALLKTMEEPPTYAKIILLAENSSRFLPTILSRCIQLNLKELDELTVKRYLETHQGIGEEEASLYASFSRGNIGRAMMLRDSEQFHEIRGDIINALEAKIRQDEFEVMVVAEKLASYKDQGPFLLDLMTSWLRDLLIFKKTSDKKYIIHKDHYKTLLKQSSQLSYNGICDMLQKVEESKRLLKVNVNFQLCMEIILLEIS